MFIKDTRYFLLFTMVVIALVSIFVFLLSQSLVPREEQAPRRSRAVVLEMELQAETERRD